MEEANVTAKCVRCGRACETVPLAELREWIVDVGGVVLCPPCAKRRSKEASGSVA
jgi:hypothetical protein